MARIAERFEPHLYFVLGVMWLAGAALIGSCAHELVFGGVGADMRLVVTPFVCEEFRFFLFSHLFTNVLESVFSEVRIQHPA